MEAWIVFPVFGKRHTSSRYLVVIRGSCGLSARPPSLVRTLLLLSLLWCDCFSLDGGRHSCPARPGFVSAPPFASHGSDMKENSFENKYSSLIEEAKRDVRSGKIIHDCSLLFCSELKATCPWRKNFDYVGMLMTGLSQRLPLRTGTNKGTPTAMKDYGLILVWMTPLIVYIAMILRLKSSLKSTKNLEYRSSSRAVRTTGRLWSAGHYKWVDLDL